MRASECPASNCSMRRLTLAAMTSWSAWLGLHGCRWWWCRAGCSWCLLLVCLCFTCRSRHVPTCRTPPGEGGGSKAQGEGYHPPLERSRRRNGKGEAQRRSAQAKRGRLGRPLAPRDRGRAPERTWHFRYKTDRRHGLQRSATAMVTHIWATHDDVVCPGKRVGSWINVCSFCRAIRKKRCR